MLQTSQAARDAIDRLVTVELHPTQRRALESFVHGIGVEPFAASDMLTLINERQFRLAAEEFGRWVYDGRTRNKLKAMVRQRALEREEWECGGYWPDEAPERVEEIELPTVPACEARPVPVEIVELESERESPRPSRGGPRPSSLLARLWAWITGRRP